MLADIQWAFSVLVRSVDWMDADTKIATMDKAAAVKQFVGFPEWLLDKDDLEWYYGGVSKTRHIELLSSYVFKYNTLRFEDKIVPRLQPYFMARQPWWS
jgi:predicted metalloendopeptidase